MSKYFGPTMRTHCMTFSMIK